jgi:hypothetical protein
MIEQDSDQWAVISGQLYVLDDGSCDPTLNAKSAFRMGHPGNLWYAFGERDYPIPKEELVKYLTPIFFFVLAAFAIFFGVMGSEFRLGGLGGTPTSKPLPTWIGRIWFFGIAAVMVYLGIRGLR